MTDPFENYLEEIGRVDKVLKLRPEVRAKLCTPNKIIEVNFPVRRDNGQTENFTGFRVQFNNTLGPYKGGIRFHPDVNLAEVKALAAWMAIKTAVASLPFGGGKGGVIVNPKSLSTKELERLSRAYARAIANDIGPYLDVPAPDVGTTAQIMRWMAEEYIKKSKVPPKARLAKGGKSQKSKVLATFTGKPLDFGGSEGREEATGAGGLYVLTKLAKMLHVPCSMFKVAIQGFGNVGYFFAVLAQKAGFKIIAVSDSTGGALMEKGDWKMEDVLRHKRKTGSVAGFPRSTPITNDQLLITNCDVLVPAALENVIDKNNASRIKAKTILELANGPITPEADLILEKKKVIVVPDVLANCGGVTVSYFEWRQNIINEHWPKDVVLKKLKTKITAAFTDVWKLSREKKLSLRSAAYVFAIQRITKQS